jgi:hypothetical protein
MEADELCRWVEYEEVDAFALPELRRLSRCLSLPLG